MTVGPRFKDGSYAQWQYQMKSDEIMMCIPSGSDVKALQPARLSFVRLFNSPKPSDSRMLQDRGNSWSEVKECFI